MTEQDIASSFAAEAELNKRFDIRSYRYEEKDRLQRLKNYAHSLSRQLIDETVESIVEEIEDENIARKVIKKMCGREHIPYLEADGCEVVEGKVRMRFRNQNDWTVIEVDPKTGEISDQ